MDKQFDFFSFFLQDNLKVHYAGFRTPHIHNLSELFLQTLGVHVRRVKIWLLIARHLFSCYFGTLKLAYLFEILIHFWVFFFWNMHFSRQQRQGFFSCLTHLSNHQILLFFRYFFSKNLNYRLEFQFGADFLLSWFFNTF